MTNTPWNVYPRPQMKREQWQSLNGLWTMNEQAVTVPFPPQSLLSGFKGEVPEQLCYELSFSYPEQFSAARTLLHFGAVDQIAEVWLNEHFLGKHEGGYLPFSFDISDTVRKDSVNQLKVLVTDTLDKTYPYGKQTKTPGGMWYTPVSGIWQSVWLESVPENYIHGITLDCDLNSVNITLEGIKGGFIAEIDGKKTSFGGNSGRLTIENPILWTPEEPHLYPLIITTAEDRIESYFALRTIEIKQKSGVNRVLLNGEPIFLHGVLDQGYFSDGIFLPAEAEEYSRDVLRMKGLGFNLLRKHIKIEPEQFYYDCDRLGMLVMQDMVNSGSYSFLRDTALPTIGFSKRSDKCAEDKRTLFFRQQMLDTLRHLRNHPSVVAYTIFNEGWGQHNSDELYQLAKATDPSRLYDSTSGWFHQKQNDFDSQHIYFRLKKLKPQHKPLLVSECGGYTMAVEGHLFNKDKQYGYGSCKNMDELSDKIVEMYEKMIFPAIQDGCCGCIYTQLSDVEEEINGFYTYDRRVRKVDQEKMLRIASKLRYITRAL